VLEPTNLLLLACALIYGLIGEAQEAAILLVFVGAISLLDLWQQRRSRRALAELARLSAPRARVRRHGIDLELAPEQVQIGDQLRLEEGDRVAADARLRRAVGLWLDESLLTGESLPVARQQPGELLRAGSLVATGRGWAEVVAVGETTELGRLGRSLAAVEPPPTRLQHHTRRLTTRLSVAALGLCTLLALLQGSSSGDWTTALLAALALALALLPNEIPVVLALFLGLGALRLARIGVLARWPAAVESLGSATVLAVDKTGTLTENRMAVQQLLTWPAAERWQRGAPLEEPWHPLVELAVLASRNDPVDAMERAIQQLAAEQLHHTEHLHPDWPLQREYPLQRDLLVFSRLWHDNDGQPRLAAKGAPEAVARLCHLDAAATEALLAAAAGLAREGLRVLAVARGLEGSPLHPHLNGSRQPGPPDDVHDFLFEPVGLVGLADPLRPDVPAAIARARRAGVRVVMLTGDGPQTARAIADQAGLPAGPVLCGDELKTLPGAGLVSDPAGVAVFARVRPEQKLELVRSLQASGEVVAMTGDGVNDAPALKAADIGVAMGRRGTAVAREAADLVLLRDDFGSLVEALALGRRIDANLHRALGYTLAIHLPIAALSVVPLLLPGQPLLLLPVHIALLHLVIDPACTVVFEAIPAGAGQMQRPPRPPDAPLFGAATWRRALLQGGALTLAALLLGSWPGLDTLSRRSLVFSLLLLAGGGLVWLNGDPRSRVTQLGAAIGLGLWLLVQTIPGLHELLLLTSLQARPAALLLAALAGLVLLGALERSRGRAAGFS
jgi:Ca2+-transporting ATPase